MVHQVSNGTGSPPKKFKNKLPKGVLSFYWAREWTSIWTLVPLRDRDMSRYCPVSRFLIMSVYIATSKVGKSPSG